MILTAGVKSGRSAEMLASTLTCPKKRLKFRLLI
jgi:hypothetical protein